MSSPVTHPEIDRLRLRCADLRLRLRETVEEWHHLVVEERPRLTSHYDRLFGDLERERQRLALQGAELFRRVELLTIKAARGETITPEIVELVNTVVDKEYARLRQRLREALDMDVTQREQAARDRQNTVADNELTTMYRTLAKRLHPDTVGESEELLATWHRVQQAYRDRDGGRLRTLLTVLGADEQPDQTTDQWDVQRWQREERQLSARLRMEQRKLSVVKAEEPFSIAADLEQEQWQQRHRADLEADIRSKQTEIDEHQRRYAELTGGAVPPGTVADPKRDADFDQEFMENTYFAGR